MWIDGHLDLAYMALEGRDLCAPCPDEKSCISFPDLREGGVTLVFGTIFTEPDPEDPSASCGYASDDPDEANQVGLIQLDIYKRLEDAGEIRIVRTKADLKPSDEAGSAIRILLLMEGADPIRSPEEVPIWHARGLRMVGMSWWRGTRYAGGNGNQGPLSDIGVAFVHALDEAGMIHDASHLSDNAFDGLLEHARGRIVASHSNCRALMGGEDQRHLRDDQVKAIGERGGIVGLNLYSKFLVPEGRAAIQDCVKHVSHITELMGHRRGVALGTDADGGFGPEKLPQDLDHPRKYDNLAMALRNAGWSDDEVDGFTSNNWLRLLRETLPD